MSDTSDNDWVGEMLNIGLKEAQTRLRTGKCLNCGVEDQTCVELNSCAKPDCVRELRKLYAWTKRVIGCLSDDSTTCYSNSVRLK